MSMIRPIPDVVTTADGAAITVHDLGGDGTPLVLAHATGFHGLTWAPAARHLADVSRSISFDQRGHGLSSLPPGWDFDWEGLATDVLTVVDALGVDRPYAAGHSSGATALLLAEESRPGAFAGLYCYEPVVVPVKTPLGRDPDSWLAARARRRRDAFASREEAFTAYAGRAPFASFDPEVVRAYVDHGFEEVPDDGVRLRCRPETEARIAEMATAHDCFARLGDIACPVTIACGSETDAYGPAVLEAQAEPLRQATTEVLPGLTHFGPMEDPEAVAASIRRSLHA
jgi:pimeloyl-ACP methyl ester carboxylesterase